MDVVALMMSTRSVALPSGRAAVTRERMRAARRLRRIAATTLALLCVFVMAAGTIVAHLLPARLDKWDGPQVRPAAVARAQPLLPAAGPGTALGGAAGAGAVTPAGLAAALTPLLTAATLGPHVGLLVTSLATGQVLDASNATAGFTPASTTKIATSVAALSVLGPQARFVTRVVAGASPTSIVLVGGGDPTLAAGTPPASDYPRPATLAQLAAQTARALRARGRARVAVQYDASLYTGPAMAPGWPDSYVTTGNVTPISALEVDQGRLTASGAPQDADDPQNGRARTFAPAAEAAVAFAGFLRADGISVLQSPAAATAARGAATLASVSSPPLAQIVAQMLLESNNVMAENLARHVAIATGAPASFSGGAAADAAVLRRLGVSGVSLVDGSGLSPRDRITPQALVRLLTAASSPAQGRLRAVITGLPVAGFSGTLAAGGSVFASAGPAARGVVRAKTGNLTTVAALAGIAYAANGQLLAFAIMADQLPAGGLDTAGAQIAKVATALAACGCHRAG
jgi:D-alanyl-D-alanine carboxypeptidase/D-alanyl-D-alanine-endopeptidase (penicillin-binding protein 4)